ncbi:MAG: 30S ribosomal protein S8e [Candidatus Micrarchaeia archaeon]
MSQYHKPTEKKVSRGTGGKRRGKQKDKKKCHYGRESSFTRIAEKEERKKVCGRGNTEKIKLKKAQYVNVSNGGVVKKTKILAVLESQIPDYVRRNIITRGAIVNTEMGKVRITNRVGQDGIINGTIVKDK